MQPFACLVLRQGAVDLKKSERWVSHFERAEALNRRYDGRPRSKCLPVPQCDHVLRAGVRAVWSVHPEAPKVYLKITSMFYLGTGHTSVTFNRN